MSPTRWDLQGAQPLGRSRRCSLRRTRQRKATAATNSPSKHARNNRCTCGDRWLCSTSLSQVQRHAALGCFNASHIHASKFLWHRMFLLLGLERKAIYCQLSGKLCQGANGCCSEVGIPFVNGHEGAQIFKARLPPFGNQGSILGNLTAQVLSSLAHKLGQVSACFSCKSQS